MLDAALDVFAEKGIDGASVKDVAAAAGVTPGLLYHYFAGKEALVTALLRERGFARRLRELLEQDRGRSATEVLPRVMREFDGLLAANAKLLRLFFAAGHSHENVRSVLAEFVAEGQAAMADYLRSRVAEGELRDHDAHTTATALFASLAVGRSAGIPVDVAELVGLVLHGLVRPDGDTPPETEREITGA
ncbi:TetR/AcrR family transcriptional regulator [Nocardia lijiangensis]|uniref:TetR/AcrR family transcriptional regulator n=1 Tax=Nocardia lijiangensis TaxID=299618 RepID=UPI003D755DE7